MQDTSIVFYPSEALTKRKAMLQTKKNATQTFFFSIETEDLLYLIFEFCGIPFLPNIICTCKPWKSLFYRTDALENLFILQCYRLFFFIQKGYPCIQFPSALFVSSQHKTIFKQYPNQIDWYTLQSTIWDQYFFKSFENQLPLLEKCFDNLLIHSTFSFTPISIEKIIQKREQFAYTNLNTSTVYHFNILSLIDSFMFHNFSNKDASFFQTAFQHPKILSDYKLYYPPDSEEILKICIQHGAKITNVTSHIQQLPHLKSLLLNATSPKERALFNFASDSQNKQFIYDYVQFACDDWYFCDAKVKENRIYLRKLIYYHPRVILQIPEQKRTKELISIALSRDGMLLAQLSKSEQKSIDFIEAAVKNNPNAFEFARDKFKADKDLILCLLKNSPKILKFASRNLLANECFVNQFIKVNPNCFEFLPLEYRKDVSIIKHCLQYNPMLLEHVDDELKNNLEIVEVATRISPKPFKFAGNQLKNDEKFVTSILKRNGLLLKYVSKELRGDLSIATIAVEENPLALEFVRPPASLDTELVAQAMHQNAYVLRYVDKI